jgi:hypothetical protein
VKQPSARRALLGAFLTLSAGACHQVKPLGTDEMRVSGTIEKTEVGVDCWRLVGRDSVSYELQKAQVPPNLLIHGKIVTLVVKPRPDLMSACQVGQIVDVVTVEY